MPLFRRKKRKTKALAHKKDAVAIQKAPRRIMRVHKAPLLYACLCLGAMSPIHAQIAWIDTLSADARISWITHSPSEKAIHLAFGHTSIRIQDKGMDVSFNYGVFDFDSPNFYLNYVFGRLMYSVAAFPFAREKQEAALQGISLWEQELNLSYRQKQAFYNQLKENIRPENRTYRYHYFKNNCANKPLNILQATLLNDITLHYDTLAEKKETYRTLINKTLQYYPFLHLGMNIVLGSVTDKTLSYREYLFLPAYIQQVFMHTSIRDEGRDESSPHKPLVRNEGRILEGNAKWVRKPYVEILIWSILIIILFFTYREHQKNTDYGMFIDAPLLFLLGILGNLILFMWFATAHESQGNYNILWAMPTHLIACIWLIIRRKRDIFMRYYYIASSVVLVLVILGWRWFPQSLPTLILPLLIGVLIRFVRFGLYFPFLPAHGLVKKVHAKPRIQ